MKREYSLVLELCKFLNPDKNKIKDLLEYPLDYPLVLGQMLYNRMGSAAYQTLKQCDLSGHINREFHNVLANVYQLDCTRTESYIQSVEMIGRILNNADFPYALLKGAYLISIYPKGLRTSNDIDVLIEQENITKLSELLIQNGFTQGYLRNGNFCPATRLEIINSRMNRGETVPFIKKVDLSGLDYCEIDINFSIDSVAYQKNDIVSKMLENSQRRIMNISYTLCPADFLIHLCAHLFKEATIINWVYMGRDLSLYKFCDIYFLLKKWMNDEFYKAMKDRVYNYGLQRECYYALYYTKELFQIENTVLEKLLKEIKPSDTAYLKEIVNLSENKKYYYDMPFIEWFFCGNRGENLYNVMN